VAVATDGIAYLVEVGTEPADPGARDTVGGWPVLPDGELWPRCDCGEAMVCFLHLDVPADVPAFGGDHLAVFQCPHHNDACMPPSDGRLPQRFWDAPPDEQRLFWRITLTHQGTTSATRSSDDYLQVRPLTLHRIDEQVDEYGRGRAGFKIGGTPSWAQSPEHYTCPCGAELAMVCQVPENFGFERQPGRPSQPDTFDDDQYGLFLGNEIYVVACPEHCHPAAAWPILQN
jgi:hypothetical protein